MRGVGGLSTSLWQALTRSCSASASIPNSRYIYIYISRVFSFCAALLRLYSPDKLGALSLSRSLALSRFLSLSRSLFRARALSLFLCL
jgi:hypothetical protein